MQITGVMRLLPCFASEQLGVREGSNTAGAGRVLAMGGAGGNTRTERGVGTPVGQGWRTRGLKLASVGQASAGLNSYNWCDLVCTHRLTKL